MCFYQNKKHFSYSLSKYLVVSHRYSNIQVKIVQYFFKKQGLDIDTGASSVAIRLAFSGCRLSNYGEKATTWLFLAIRPWTRSRVPRASLYTRCQNKKTPLLWCLFVLAGAQGLEPWARGFGDRCSTN